MKTLRVTNWFAIFILAIFILAGCVTANQNVQAPTPVPSNVAVAVSKTQPNPQLSKLQSTPLEQKNGVTWFGASKKYQKNGITVLVLRGEPFEMGYAQGVLTKDEIKSWGTTFELVSKRKWKRIIKKLETFTPQEYIEELKGVAEGSGVNYETLLMLNDFQGEPKMACTSIAVKGIDGKLLRSRNFDYMDWEVFNHLMLIIRQPKSGYAFASMSPPGLIGVMTAMNEKGVTFGLHKISGTQRSFSDGMPTFLLDRYVIQYAGSIEETGQILQNATPRRAPYLWMITGPERAGIYEFSKKKIEFIEMTEDYLILTNHTRKLAVGKDYPNSMARMREAKSYLKQHKDIDVEKLVELNRGDNISWKHNNKVHNLHAAIFRPSDRDFWIAIDPQPPATKGRWFGFNLNTELDGQGNDPDPTIIPAEK